LEQIGRYHIEGELGKGAMGLVYRATDPNIGRTVALKTMRLDVHGIEAEEMLQRFRNEARSAGVLNHPNIVTIYDAGEADGLFYMAMEVIEGETLQQLLSRSRVLPVEQVLSLCRQVGEGLDFAHERHVIHRDIKPANIMITTSGLVKIMDFGIAKAGGGLTSTGQVLGTPNYMSPEQVKGKPLDGRTDLFSLGVVLYEMLTGEKPFGAQNVTTIIYKIVHEDPIPPRELDVSIHPGLSAVVARALSKDPEMRYQSGAKLAADLENYKSYGTDLDATQAMNPAMVTASMEQVKAAAATMSIPAAAVPEAKVAAPEPVAEVPAPVAVKAPEAVKPPAKPPAPAPKKPQGSINKGLVIGAVAVVLVMASYGVRAMRHRSEVAEVPTTTAPATPAPPPLATPPVDPNANATTAAVPPATETVPATTEAQPSVPPPTPKGKAASKPSVKAAVAAPAAKAASGDLTIVSTPAGATVKLDGRKLTGVTPLTEKDVPVGKHTLQVSATGYAAATRPVDITSGAATTATFPLVAAQGTVKVSSTPAGAEIFVDGAAANKKTPSEFTLGKGDHTFMVRMQGFEEAGDLIHVSPGESLTFAPTLSAARKVEGNPFKKVGKFFAGDEKGTLNVTTEPAGAFVFINGRRVPGQTPLTTAAPVGHLSMAIRKTGFAPVQKAVTVEKGKATTVTQPLTAAKEQ
jgi:predicted Ser/Thr protein kinase